MDLYGIAPDRPSTAAPAGPPRALARGLAPDAPRRRADARLLEPTGRFPFVTVDGHGVYEIPVGPVHAGLIEPGHFRFSVVGETILRLKARLWFVHRGIEKLFQGRRRDRRGRARRTHQRRHLRRPRPGLQPGRRRRPRHRRPRRGPPAAGVAARTRTPLQPRHRPRCAGQRRRLRPGQRARAAHPRTTAAAQRTRHRPPAAARRHPPGGCRAASSARPSRTAAIAADIAEVAGWRSRNSVRLGPVRRHPVLSRDHARELGCLGYVARASGIAHRRPPRPSQRPPCRSPRPAAQPATCWPATPCAATSSPHRSHWSASS